MRLTSFCECRQISTGILLLAPLRVVEASESESGRSKVGLIDRIKTALGTNKPVLGTETQASSDNESDSLLPTFANINYVIAYHVLPRYVFASSEKVMRLWGGGPLKRLLYKASSALLTSSQDIGSLPNLVFERGTLSSGTAWYAVEFTDVDSGAEFSPCYAYVIHNPDGGVLGYNVITRSSNGNFTHRLIQANGVALNFGDTPLRSLNDFSHGIGTMGAKPNVFAKLVGKEIKIYNGAAVHILREEFFHSRKFFRLQTKWPDLPRDILGLIAMVELEEHKERAPEDEPKKHSKVSQDTVVAACADLYSALVHEMSEAHPINVKETKILVYSAIRAALNSYSPDSSLDMREVCSRFDAGTASGPMGVGMGLEVDIRSKRYFDLFRQHHQDISRGARDAFDNSLAFHFEQFCLGGGGQNSPVILADIFEATPNRVLAVQIWWKAFPEAAKILNENDV